MKIANNIALAIALGLLQPMVSGAEDLFKLSWHATAYSTSSSGTVTARSFTEKDIINKYAADNSLDPKSLLFVYRADKHDTVLVAANDGHFIADIIQMETAYTEVSNSTHTQTIRQAFLTDEAHGQLGSAFGTEREKIDTNTPHADGTPNRSMYSFKGTFQYTIQGVLYSGTFATGAKVKDVTAGTP